MRYTWTSFACAMAFVFSVIGAGSAASIQIGDPGFYGRLDLDGFSAPRLIFQQPRIIVQQPAVQEEPLYLRVPPGHARQWKRYCHRYQACSRPVYFVDDEWYGKVYRPRYREMRQLPSQTMVREAAVAVPMQRESPRKAYKEKKVWSEQDPYYRVHPGKGHAKGNKNKH